MPRAPLLFITATALLTACVGELGPIPSCGPAPSAPTADTAIAFKVDGRQVLQGSGGFYPQMYYYTPGGFVEIIAGVGDSDDFEALSLRLNRFHGAGAYPIYASGQNFPAAMASYSCTRLPGETWVGDAAIPDTVYVTGYDSTTAAISGTFHFSATSYKYGLKLTVTDGSFQGFAPTP